MIRNASVGDYIFFQEPYFNMDKGARRHRKVHTLVTEKDGLEGTILKSQLNSLGRWAHPVWVDSELADHEVDYMLENSKRNTYV